LDALRGLAVVLMVQQHLGFWLTAAHRLRGPYYSVALALNSLGGAAAPLFVFLAGAGVALGSHLNGVVLLRRGVALLACAYALNLACPSWFSPGSFYVLHLIASFWLLAGWLRQRSDRILIGLVVLVLLLTVAAQTWLRTPPHLMAARLRDTSLPGGMLRLALLEGHFPLLPWLAFGLLGLWAGRQLRAERGTALFAAAGILLSSYVLLRLPRLFLLPRELRRLPWRSVVDFSFYPATVAFVLGLCGVSAALVALGSSRAGGKAGSGGLGRWLAALGRTSLTLLVVHVVVFRQGSVALGLYQRLAPGLVLGLIVLLLAVFGLAAQVWARVDYRYSLEWWIRQAGGRVDARGERASPATPQDLPR